MIKVEKNSVLNLNLSKLFLFFIVFQPILDIGTSFSMRYMSFPITIGIAVRMLFLLLGVILVFLDSPSKLKRFSLILLFSFGIISLLSFVSGFVYKPIFSFFDEVQFYAKGMYTIVIFLAYLHAIKHLKNSDSVNSFLVIKYITIAMTVVSASIIISIITGTSMTTYKYSSSGYKGWFFAGNEISAIMAVGLPATLLYAHKRMETISRIYYWIPVILLTFCLVMMGTKVSFLSAVLVLGAVLLYDIINAVVKSDRSIGKSNIAIIVLMLAVIYVVTPYTPAFTNTSNLVIQEEVDKQLLEDTKNENESSREGSSGESFFESAVTKISPYLSSRDLFLINTHNNYMKAPLVQKIFGTGYSGNYTRTPKVVEMDLFDLFYSYGFIGTVIFLMPGFYLIGYILKNLRDVADKLFKAEFIFSLIGLGLGFAIAAFSGHVLFAPAVSIYLAILLAYMYWTIGVFEEN